MMKIFIQTKLVCRIIKYFNWHIYKRYLETTWDLIFYSAIIHFGVEHWSELYISDNVEEKAHAPVPIAEYAHYVNELKANDNEELQKEYDVSNRNKVKRMSIIRH